MLEQLTPSRARADLLALVDELVHDSASGERRCMRYEPLVTRPLGAVHVPPALGGFTAAWRDKLEASMLDVAQGPAEALVRATRYLQAQGGKRLRGLLALAAASANGGDPSEALEAAALVEWLHQTSLILDDIIDAAHVRRGVACLHRLTTPEFTVATSAFLLLRCAQVARQLPKGVSQALFDGKLMLLKGECLEVALEPGARASLTSYYRIIEAKTAALFACAATVGALCSPDRAELGRVAALAMYGREIGLAFQIIDDLLDYVGDEHLLGKRPGTDFRNGRLTLPAILLAESTKIPDHADFEWTRKAILDGEIGDACRARARRHIDRALAALSSLPESDGRNSLESLAWAIVDRRS